MTAKLLELRTIDLSDMASGLRRWADRIESGEVQCDTVVILAGSVGEDIQIAAFGLHASSLEIQGWLTEAQITLYNLAKYQNKSGGVA